MLKDLMEILVCPECRKKVRLADSGVGIVCDNCGLEYPVRDGIPVMLSSEARKLGS